MKKEVIGKSVQGKEIELFELGSGTDCVIVIGCMHGDEQQSYDISKYLLEVYKHNEHLLKTKRLIILPKCNPDGYESGKRVNSKGVDINRNFPSTNWVKSQDKDEFYSGDSAASEPETQTIIELINDYDVKLIITIHQPYKVINFDGPARKYAEIMSQWNKYEIVESIGYPTPGSLGTYAGIDKNIPVITLELPENIDTESLWNENKSGLMAVIDAV